GRPFTGADDPRNRQNINSVAVPELPEPESEVEDGASEVLRALRWSFRNFGLRCKGTPQQEVFRKLHKRNPAKFLDLLTKHEQLFQQTLEKSLTRPKGQARTTPPDQGDEHLRGLIDGLLQRVNRRMREEQEQFVKDGRCATCGQVPIPGLGEAGRILAGRS